MTGNAVYNKKILVGDFVKTNIKYSQRLLWQKIDTPTITNLNFKYWPLVSNGLKLYVRHSEHHKSYFAVSGSIEG